MTAIQHVAGYASICLHVADLDRSVAFYRDALGIPLERHETWAATYFGGVEFVVELPHDGRGVIPGTLEVTFDATDLERTAAALRADGHVVDGPHRAGQGDYINVTDPDGYIVSLMRRAARA